MTCFVPLKCWEASERQQNGRKQIYFGKRRKHSDMRAEVKCGQCIGCRLDRSREWAIRCAHEAKEHSENCFITLTYAEDPVTLIHADFQKFMKKLRRALPGQRFQYYMAGEYGSVYDANGTKKDGLLGRPHFHMLLFGYDFPDRVFYKRSPSGIAMYNSEFLSDRWGHGHAVLQDFSIEAAAYVARYVTKKITGDRAAEHYTKVDVTTGEIIEVEPEYNRMSLKPAIGKRWLEKYYADVYPKDFVTEGGIKFKPPRYYDKMFEHLDPAKMAEIKEKRQEVARAERDTPERLETRHEVKKLQAKRLLRPL